MTDEKNFQDLFNQDLSSSQPPADLVENVIAVSQRRIAAMDMLNFGIGPLFATLLHLLAPLVRLLAPVMAQNMTRAKKP